MIASLHSCPDTGGISEEDVEADMKEIERILESDCVCEKKEWYEWRCPHCEYSCVGNSKKGHEESVAEHKEYCPKEKHSHTGEKKEESLDRNIDLPSVDYAYYKDRINNLVKSQSPCEPMTDRAELSHCEHERMSYLYLPANLASPGLFLCKKCGLVTCLNPNDK